MSRIKPLVTQHLEYLSRDVIEQYRGLVTDYICDREGIYALYAGKALYYVGLASNLHSRLSSHLRDKHKDSWDHFSVYLTISDTHIKELESLLLRISFPKGNSVRGRFEKSENLKRKFTRRIKKAQKEELQKLTGGQRYKVSAAARKTVAPKKSKATGKVPVLSPYVGRVKKIRCKFANKTVRARVRQDGSIGLWGEVFNSPSHAAKHVCAFVISSYHDLSSPKISAYRFVASCC